MIAVITSSNQPATFPETNLNLVRGASLDYLFILLLLIKENNNNRSKQNNNSNDKANQFPIDRLLDFKA